MLDCSNISWVDNHPTYDYILTRNITFTSMSGINFGYFKAYDKNTGALLIWGNGKSLVIYKGYSWDGCTGIGKVYESEQTLMAALLHDALYQVGKQTGYDSSFTLRQADKEFLWVMKALRSTLDCQKRMVCRSYICWNALEMR